MPKIRKLKKNARNAFYLEQVRERGPCLRVGSEIWEVENVNVKVGIITKIENDVIHIKRQDGTVAKRPESALLFTEPVRIEGNE